MCEDLHLKQLRHFILYYCYFILGHRGAMATGNATVVGSTFTRGNELFSFLINMRCALYSATQHVMSRKVDDES